MRSYEFITELRKGLMRYVSDKFPNMPEYVARDLIYKNSKMMTNDVMKTWTRYYGSLKWKYNPNFEISFKILDNDTAHTIKDYMSRSDKPDQLFSKDAERYAKQREMIKQRGISKEPIIVEESRDEPGKFALLEGWHRTVEQLKVFPDGYTCAAYIGYRTEKSNLIAKKTPPTLWQQFTSAVKNLIN